MWNFKALIQYIDLAMDITIGPVNYDASPDRQAVHTALSRYFLFHFAVSFFSDQTIHDFLKNNVLISDFWHMLTVIEFKSGNVKSIPKRIIEEEKLN